MSERLTAEELNTLRRSFIKNGALTAGSAISLFAKIDDQAERIEELGTENRTFVELIKDRDNALLAKEADRHANHPQLELITKLRGQLKALELRELSEVPTLSAATARYAVLLREAEKQVRALEEDIAAMRRQLAIKDENLCVLVVRSTKAEQQLIAKDKELKELGSK